MVKPAGLMSYSEGITLRPSRSTFTSEDAVISSNIQPYGLMRKWCSGPGTRADVGKDEIIPAIERDEAVGCSEVDAYFPLILADLIADAEGDLRVSDAHGGLLLAEVCNRHSGSRTHSITSSQTGEHWLRRSFGQPGFSQSIFQSQEIFGTPIRPQHVFESGNTQRGIELPQPSHCLVCLLRPSGHCVACGGDA